MSEVRSEPRLPDSELYRRVEMLERNVLNHERLILALRAPVSDASAGACCPALTRYQIIAAIQTADLSRAELWEISLLILYLLRPTGP
jgi:hypothetical protein